MRLGNSSPGRLGREGMTVPDELCLDNMTECPASKLFDIISYLHGHN